MKKFLGHIAVIFQIFFRDIKRLIVNPIACIVVAGAIVLPSLYAWYTIAAFWAPYQHTEAIEVAVVNNDKGASSELTGEVNVGREVTEELSQNHQLGWKITNEQEAMDGVESGQYFAAIVLPENFSASYLSVLDGHFDRPQIHFYVNDEKTASGVKIAEAGASALEKSINQQFVSSVSKKVLAVIQKSNKNILASTDAATGSLTEGVREADEAIASTSQTLNSLADALGSASAVSSDAKGQLESAQGDITNLIARLKAAQDQVEAVKTDIDSFSEAIWPQAGSSEALSKLNTNLDDLYTSLGLLRGALTMFEPVMQQSISLTTSLQATLQKSKSICESAQGSLQQLKSGLDTSLSDLQSLQNSAFYQALRDQLGISDSQFSQFLAQPVQMETSVIFPVKNYGSGVAPFFTNLALWVASFILMAIVRIRVDPAGLPKFSRLEAYFGRWLTYVVFGLIQGAVVCAGELIIGVECLDPVAFIAAGMLTAFVYVNLMFALAYSMRHLGKAIAVFLLILQIPGSSGMFPVEMMPNFYQALNPLLPFTYSIDAMREAMAGFYGTNYATDLLVLTLVYLPLGFMIGLVVGKYDYNLNILFDRNLGKTDLFLSEGASKLQPAFRLSKMVQALLNTSEYRSFIIERARRFDGNYTKLARIGWIALFAMPVLMMVCTSIFKGSPNDKLIMLAWFFFGLMAVAIYLICISFLKSTIEFQMQLAGGQKSEGDKNEGGDEK